MKIEGWRYYNHLAIPTAAPHENPKKAPIEDNSIWQIDHKTPLLARWTTDFDCGYETNWWYVIKDTPFDISKLKAKRRYEINKGVKNFNVIKINPLDFKEELYNVTVAAFSAYPKKRRPTVNKESFISGLETWENYILFGAFYRETNELCGYVWITNPTNGCINFTTLKTKPQHEKNAVNAALVEGILRYFNNSLANGCYICDGERTINHETAFQDYLEKYFAFRKAYCKLHVVYNPKFKFIIKFLYRFRKLLLKFDGIKIIHNLNSVLRMEEIVKNDNNKNGINNKFIT